MGNPETLEKMMGWGREDTPGRRYYDSVAQHTDEWHRLRCGVITASIMKNLVKKKTDKKTGAVEWSVPDEDKLRAYLFEIAAERISGVSDGTFQSFDMMRGVRDEADAFNLYSEKYQPLRTCGFIVNTMHGVTIGYSPDGLTALNDDGQIECKSRKQKFHVETLFLDEMPDEYEIQVQTGLLVTGRKWCDFVQFCGGMEMYVKRIYPDLALHDVIIAAARKAEEDVSEIVDVVKRNASALGLFPTVRRIDDITA